METQPSRHYYFARHVCGRCSGGKVDRREMSKRGVICVFLFCGRTACVLTHKQSRTAACATVYCTTNRSRPSAILNFFFFIFFPPFELQFRARPSVARRRSWKQNDGEKSVRLLFLRGRISRPLLRPPPSPPTSSMRLYPRSREKRGTLEDCIKNLVFLKHARLIT